MKRSRRVALTGLMASTAIALSACGEEDVPVQAYATVDQCVADGLFDRATCGEMFNQAMTIHEEAAPRYESAELCEEQFGLAQCTYRPVEMVATGEGQPEQSSEQPGEQPGEQQPQQQAGGGGFFMPLFMGYMAGRMLGGAQGMPPAMQRNHQGNTYGVQPYYRTAEGRFTGVRGQPVNVTRGGAATMPRSAFTGSLQTPRVATRTTVMQRGGFGATASRPMAFGG